jgi:hypothetical protein
MNNIAKEYYKKVQVQFEICKLTMNRETVFLSPNPLDKLAFRCIKMHHICYMDIMFKNFHFLSDTRSMNIYFSLATLKDMPVMSFWMETRKQQQELFNKEFHKYFLSYDLAFDFEGKKDYKECWYETNDLKTKFDEFKIPYILSCSGSGFHIRIPNFFDLSEVTDMKKKKRLMKLNITRINRIGKNIKDLLDYDTLDTGVFDIRRIWKCPYSIDFKSGNVALPLNDMEFKDCLDNLDYCKLENVMIRQEKDNNYLFNRGIYLREGNLANFRKFAKKYDIK